MLICFESNLILPPCLAEVEITAPQNAEKKKTRYLQLENGPGMYSLTVWCADFVL